jgi:hypothetical protein
MALAACQGGSESPAVATIPCNVQVGFPPLLIYPAPGAIGVPDGNFNVILTGAYGPAIALTSALALTVVSAGPTTAPSPLPSSSIEPSPTSGVAYRVPALQASTLYAIVAQQSVSAPCVAPTVTLGSFTTQ